MAVNFSGSAPQVWDVGALCHAVADTLSARFNPVAVRGELSSFSRAASGHCYFTLKDQTGQIRCAMFRREASALNFAPRDGELVEVRANLSVYEARGDLQLVVQSMQKAGQGALFEQFLLLKAKLTQEGLFAPERKQAVPAMPRVIGVVTSLGAAALHDVVTALQRRAPHIPVIVAPAAVQGAGAPAELLHGLQQLVAWRSGELGVDVILMVRGGGAMEDLWAFNDENLVRAVASCPVPVVSGVGHETDFTLLDFAADLRAPTPTAAAELVATDRGSLEAGLSAMAEQCGSAVERQMQRQGQRLDQVSSRMGRPSSRIAAQAAKLERLNQSMRFALGSQWTRQHAQWERCAERLPRACKSSLQVQKTALAHLKVRLELLDPRLVLERGYAWLTDQSGKALTHAHDFQVGQLVQATLSDGVVDLQVKGQKARSVADK